MENTRPKFGAMAVLLILPTILTLSAPAGASPWVNRDRFAAPEFRRQWARTDSAEVHSNRTWYWGPGPWLDYYEFYREAPHGLRLVQYFDKARMEINDRRERRVTNGLLVVEMVSGQLKLGDHPADNALRTPSHMQVAGDISNANAAAPRYSSFRSVATINDPNLHRAPEQRGQPVSAIIDINGNLSSNETLAAAYAVQTEVVQYVDETGHNIPRVFWDFLNRTGPVLDQEAEHERLIDWVATMGLPITEAYWVKTQLAGVERDVLIQLFERRVLTYTPTNPAGYQVELGNVGQHYFLWRYPRLGQPWAAPPYDVPIVYSSISTDLQGLYFIRNNGRGPQLLSVRAIQPFSWHHTYNQAAHQLVIGEAASRDGTRQLQAVSLDQGAWYPITGVEKELETPGNNYHPAVSPDGSKIAFASDRTGKPQLYLRHTSGKRDVQLTEGDCMSEAPGWSPDGRTLVWMANCDGSWQIFRGDLAYSEDRQDQPGRPDATENLAASLVNVDRLTAAGNNKYPRFSPDGLAIGFQSDRDGNNEIYVMSAGGATQQRLVNSTSNDIMPTWARESWLAFSSNRDGDYDIYVIRVDGSGERQLTNTTTDEIHPVWWQ